MLSVQRLMLIPAMRSFVELVPSMIETVTVMPEEKMVSFGTLISLMRTGIRCARRTHSKVALTFCSNLLAV